MAQAPEDCMPTQRAGLIARLISFWNKLYRDTPDYHPIEPQLTSLPSKLE
jgi:hypothetical protein